MTLEQGWEQVRVGDVAIQAGVSRPTIYREFGDKERLGEALVLREVSTFLEGLAVVLRREEGDVGQSVVEAVRFTFDQAGAHPLLLAALTASRTGDVGLLPFLTTNFEPLLTMASTTLVEWFTAQLPNVDPDLIAEAVDLVVRLVVSHLVLPRADSAEIARRLSRLATRYVGLPDCPLKL
jgi:AcrR family transcriptional regulator